MSQENKTKKNIALNRYLTFLLDNEKYGVEILKIKEIIGYQKSIKVPNTPSFVEGVINLRGKIIPVIDLRLKLNMPKIEPEVYTAIIIASIHDLETGFVVDQVQEVASVNEENLQEPPKFEDKRNTQFLSKMAQIDKDVIMITDLEKIFDMDELASLGSLAEDV